MNNLKPDKKRKVQNLIQYTDHNLTEQQSIKLLKNSQIQWDLNRAINYYFDNSNEFIIKQKSKVNTNHIQNIFQTYEDPFSKNNINIDGIEKLCQDLKLDISSREILILAWKLNAKVQGRFTLDEFTFGLKQLNINSVSSLSKILSEMNKCIDKSQQNFKDLYQFTFDYARDPKSKGIEAEVAIDYWKILFTLHGQFDQETYSSGKSNSLASCEEIQKFPNFHLLTHFINFINEQIDSNQIQNISRDQWTLLFDFAKDCENNIKEYDECSAWPVLIDEFVEWYKEKNLKNRNLSGNSDVIEVTMDDKDDTTNQTSQFDSQFKSKYNDDSSCSFSTFGNNNVMF